MSQPVKSAQGNGRPQGGLRFLRSQDREDSEIKVGLTTVPGGNLDVILFHGTLTVESVQEDLSGGHYHLWETHADATGLNNLASIDALHNLCFLIHTVLPRRGVILESLIREIEVVNLYKVGFRHLGDGGNQQHQRADKDGCNMVQSTGEGKAAGIDTKRMGNGNRYKHLENHSIMQRERSGQG